MHKRLFLIFSLSAIVTLTGVFNVDAATSEVSKVRIRKIADIIRKFTNANEKLSDPYVKDAIFDEVDKELTLEPEEKPNVKSVKEIAKEVRAKVAKRFPDSIKTIKDKVTTEADKKYKMAQKLDLVTIRVQKGRSNFKVTGIFYGFGVGGKSVRIGDKLPIAFFDLNPESRAMFDKTFCEREKKSYIDEKVRNYYRKKGAYGNTLFSDVRTKIAAENEKLGYIYAWDKWRTPKNVTSYLIEQISNKIAKGEPKGGDKDPDEGKPNKDPDVLAANDPNEDPLNDPAPTTDPDEPDKLRLAKLTRSIEERQLEIAGSQYGIDADQGFNKGGKRVLWGMRQPDVQFVFKGEMPQGGTGTVDTLTSKDGGPYSQIRLNYINGLFYKVEIVYAISPMDVMMVLWNKLNEKYGESKESKQMRESEDARQARLKAIKNPCPYDTKKKAETHKWHKSGKCTVCKMMKNDLHPPPPPLDQTFTWKGAITKGILHIKLNPGRTQFTEFILSKEDTNIKATQEALLDAERKRKAEEDKKKKLEEYRKSLE